MFNTAALMFGLSAVLAASVLAWMVSLYKRDVSIVDSLWAGMFLLAAATYWVTIPEPGPRAAVVVALVGLWAIRLSTYITWRNWGQEEDYRYQQIRARNEPNFALKSLYLVFGLQGVLAWVISVPLLVAMSGQTSLGPVDYAGIALWAVGMFFEGVGDQQLARFKSDPSNKSSVLDSGLWRYTRHPNYFGNACIWWGLFFMAASAGGWWTVFSPLLMTFLLLKVSGVVLLEKDIGDRRPAYRAYIERTNAFIPGPPKAVRPSQSETRVRT